MGAGVGESKLVPGLRQAQRRPGSFSRGGGRGGCVLHLTPHRSKV